MVRFPDHERSAHDNGPPAGAAGLQSSARRAHGEREARHDRAACPHGADLVRVTARQDHEVTGGEPFDATVGQHELASTLGDDVDAAQLQLVEGLVEADPERSAQLELPVRSALEAQLAQDHRQDVSARRDGRCGLPDAHRWSVHR